MLLLLRFSGLEGVGRRVRFRADNPIAPKIVSLDASRIWQLWRRSGEYYVVYETDNFNFYVFYLAREIPKDAEPVPELEIEVVRCPRCGSTDVEWVDYEVWVCNRCGWDSETTGEGPVRERVKVYEFRELPEDVEVVGGDRLDLDYICRDLGVEVSDWDEGYVGWSGRYAPVFAWVLKEKEYPYPQPQKITARVGWGWLESSSYDELPACIEFGKYISVYVPKSHLGEGVSGDKVFYARLEVSREEAREALEYLVRENMIDEFILERVLEFARSMNLMDDLRSMVRDKILELVADVGKLIKFCPRLVRELGLSEDVSVRTAVVETISDLAEQGAIPSAELATRLIEWLREAGFPVPRSLVSVREELEKEEFDSMSEEKRIIACVVAARAIMEGVRDPRRVLEMIKEEANIELASVEDAIKAMYVACIALDIDPAEVGLEEIDYRDGKLVKAVREALEEELRPEMSRREIIRAVSACQEIAPEWADGVIFIRGDVFPVKRSRFREGEYYYSHRWRSLSRQFRERAGVGVSDFLSAIGEQNLVILKDGTAWRYEIVRDERRRYTVVRLVETVDIV